MQTFKQEPINRNTLKKSSAAEKEQYSFAKSDPGLFGKLPVLQLKSSCACGGGCPTCQTKNSGLPVSHPNDTAEIEADQIADKVMRMTEGRMEPVKSYTSASAGLHRKCDQCEDEEPIQRKAENSTSSQINTRTPSHISSAMSSGGQALDRRTRAFFEPRFGRDLSGIRIFSNENAFESARRVSALAYTLGQNIVFNRNQYQPETESGKHLLAHELAHTLQAGEPTVRRAAIYSGRIKNEGTCEHLACESKWSCEDPNGVLCPPSTTVAGNRNAGTKRRPLFTCDASCEKNVACGTNYMAIPYSRFRGIKGGQCGQDLVVCANGHFAHATVRDRSEEESWEVSPGILGTLGVTQNDITNGAIYGDETDAAFLKDKRCRTAGEAPKAETPPPAPETVPYGPPAPSGGNQQPEKL